MGGCGFGNTGKGRSASEVFQQLKNDAMYEHGHGGYSGTIAEKPGFHTIPKHTSIYVTTESLGYDRL